MRRKIVTVLRGPSVWLGLRGWFLKEEGDFVIGKFWSKDDAGSNVPYLVRFPSKCVKVEEEEIQA